MEIPLGVGEFQNKKQFEGLTLDQEWLKIPPTDNSNTVFGDSYQYTKETVSSCHEAPNDAKLKLFSLLEAKGELVDLYIVYRYKLFFLSSSPRVVA